MFSYWEQKSFYYHRDLIVCGAGFTGLSAAIYFKRMNPDKSVLVVEKDPVNGGASTKNAGFACFGSPTELIADLKISDEARVFGLVEKRYKGLLNLRKLLGDDAIGYERKHGYELFRPDDPSSHEAMEKLHYLNQHLKFITGSPVYFSADEKINEFGFAAVKHMIENTGEGQVDTGRMYSSLLRLARETGVEIYNGLEVKRFEDDGTVKLYTMGGRLSCSRFLVATNGFASGLLGDRVTPARAQVILTSKIRNLKPKGCFHMLEGFYYFRDVDGRILFGGGRQTDFETETTEQLGINPDIQDHLESILAAVILPGEDFKIEQRWSGIMGMGKEKQVTMEALSPHVFCAVGLSGMGLALSTLLGKEVAEMMG